MATDNAIYIYRLTFGNTITAPTKDITQLSLEQGVRREFTESISENSNQEFYLLLQGVKVNRKIYQPTEIEAELVFMEKTTDTQGTEGMKAPSFDAVSALLLHRRVQVDLLQVDRLPDTTRTLDYKATYIIAKNCYVYELNPLLKHEVNGNKMYVKINIFSVDKLMTLNKYSKAYVARKLGSGILEPESLEFGTVKESVPLVQTSYKGQQFLQYTESNTKYEFIQPYLVQYNESFYDFLLRTSNRCGEFLYFEDGKLTLGLPEENFKADKYKNPSTDSSQTTTMGPLNIKEYESVTLQCVSSDPLDISPYARDSVKDGTGDISSLNQTVIDKNKAGYPKEAFPTNMSSNSEVATDEYIFPLFKDKFSSTAREMSYYGDGNDIAMFQATKAGKTIFSNTLDTYAGLLASLAIATIVDHGIQSITSTLQANTVNKNKNKAFIDSLKDNKEQSNGNKAVQFASLAAAGWTTLDYYNDIFKNEEAQQRQIICINMGTNFVDVRLGQKITVEGLSDNYVVIQIQQISEEAWNRDYEKYNSQGSDKYTGKRSMKIYAIPSYKNKKNVECFIPPVHPVPVIRKVGPQTAFVTANEDPKFQGRVRIAYPWQSEGSGVKVKLKEADQKLAAAQADFDKLQDTYDDLLAQNTARKNDFEDVMGYVKDTPEKREERIKKKETSLENLNEKLEKLYGERNDNRNELVVLELKINKTKDDLIRIDFLRKQISDIESKISEKEPQKKHLEQLIADMKKAADEHDQKNDTDSSYKDIEKDNTVIKKYKNDYNNVNKKYREANSDLERANKEKEKLTEICTQAAKAVEQTIAEMSTPWVRIATPMATPGGGTFFRPRVGDEVLVNYDCDNVERPYVVGSFFSKNTLTPDESYYRKQSPQIQWGNVSMAISSPNGHHISFTDPEYGGSFITNLISPGLGFYTGVLGFNKFAEGGKDLAGGIHIGDRYGIYEMEMLSHKRQINIKSPFGTVNINAFTGITISAPNGDVTIKGKNITLEAGNKITINSGTNLPQPSCGEAPSKATKAADITKLIIGGVAAAVTDRFASSIVDLSTIRHIIEVFVRPVDGTTLIKSRKFLRLEAGLGNATIKRDHYKKGTKDKMETEQKFFLELIALVTHFNGKIIQFFNDYCSLRDTFNGKRTAFNSRMTEAFKDKNKIKDFAVAMFGKAQTNISSGAAEYDYKFDDYSGEGGLKDKVQDGEVTIGGTVRTTDQAKYDALKPVIMEYYQAAFSLIKFCSKDKIEAYFKYAGAVEFSWLNAALDNTVQAKLSDVGMINDWIDKFKGYLNSNTYEGDPFNFPNEDALKPFRRALLLIFLKKAYDKPENKKKVLPEGYSKYHVVNNIKEVNNYKYFYIGYNVAEVTDKKYLDLSDDYWWKRQVKVIDRWNQNSLVRVIWDNTVQRFWGAVKDNTIGMWKKETDRQVWSSDLDGQILFSDKEDSTLSFEGESLHKETNANQGNIAHLKWILRSM